MNLTYVGKLSEDINETDLFELFGLCTTNYLGNNSDVQIPLSENTGNQRGFAYVKVWRHMTHELVKLHETEFKGKMLVIEKEKTLPKAKNSNGVNQNICPQMQSPQLDFDSQNNVASRPLQWIQNFYRHAGVPKKDNITLFSDLFVNIKKIHRQIQGDRIHVKASFLKTRSTQLNHYITPLE